MKKFKNHQRPRIKYRFDIVGHKKALKIWWDSPFKCMVRLYYVSESYPNQQHFTVDFTYLWVVGEGEAVGCYDSSTTTDYNS
jgi:hypothetical protein